MIVIGGAEGHGACDKIDSNQSKNSRKQPTIKESCTAQGDTGLGVGEVGNGDRDVEAGGEGRR